MARYVKRDGQWVNLSTGEPMLSEGQMKAPVSLPYVLSDIPEYRSPIDGKLITSRSQRRDDLKANGCVEFEPSLSPTKGKFRDPTFCKKRGLDVSEEFR